MRRRKHRLPLSTQKALGFDITGKMSCKQNEEKKNQIACANIQLQPFQLFFKKKGTFQVRMVQILQALTYRPIQ